MREVICQAAPDGASTDVAADLSIFKTVAFAIHTRESTAKNSRSQNGTHDAVLEKI